MTSSTVTTTGTWTSAGNLPTATSWYGQHDGAVALGDTGALLVAGGTDAGSAAVRRAAVFDPGPDPAHGRWTEVDPMLAPRRLHTITRLNTGQVLVTGGTSGSAPGSPALPTAELYDPVHQTWTTTGAMAGPRAGHSAVLLPDGSVLVAGGTTIRAGQTSKALRSAERYDPETGHWSTVAEMTDARANHTAVALTGTGGAVSILVCGGTAPVGTAEDPALAFCELYDPVKNRWNPTGSLLRARRHHQATRVSSHTVLVTGGTAPGAPGDGRFDPFSQRTAELYDLATGVWSPVKDMPSGRAFHRAVPFGTGQVLVVGGAATDQDEAGYRSAVIYDSGTDLWTSVPGLDTGRWAYAVAAQPGGKVLVTGGVARSGLAAADPASTELTPGTEIFAVEDGDQ